MSFISTPTVVSWSVPTFAVPIQTLSHIPQNNTNKKKNPHARGEVAYPPFPSSFCFILDNSLQTFNTRTFVSFRLKRIIPDSWLEEIIVR